jgi:pimeloyl-ACP methyl ester carboxylesterase
MDIGRMESHMMEPFYFGPASGQLFGVYHAPDAHQARDAGVVLCYPMGQEYIRSHRAFLQLALLLAAHGFHVLRFDFSSCGDSPGQGAPAHLERWVDDVATAVHELKSTVAERIGLVGLRLGATLAMMCGTQGAAIEAMVLWEPVVNGATYLAELEDLHRAWLHGSFARPRQDGTHAPGREVLGFVLSASLASELERIDAFTLPKRPAHHALIIQTGDHGEGRRLSEHLIRLGVQSRCEDIPGPPIWIKKADQEGQGLVPRPTLQCIASWMSEVL